MSGDISPIIAIIDANGKVTIDWKAAQQTAANSKANPTLRAISKALLYARDKGSCGLSLKSASHAGERK